MTKQNTLDSEKKSSGSRLVPRMLHSTGAQITMGIGAAMLLWFCCRIALPKKNSSPPTQNIAPVEDETPKKQAATVAFKKTQVASNAAPGKVS